MGSAQVLLQVASHEWSQVAIGPSGEVAGSSAALSKLRSLFSFAVFWALAVALAAGVDLAVRAHICERIEAVWPVEICGPIWWRAKRFANSGYTFVEVATVIWRPPDGIAGC
jgi:hypothetical protein